MGKDYPKAENSFFQLFLPQAEVVVIVVGVVVETSSDVVPLAPIASWTTAPTRSSSITMVVFIMSKNEWLKGSALGRHQKKVILLAKHSAKFIPPPPPP